MHCIIIATGHRKELEPLVQHRPTELFKVVNKPILFHIFDFLCKIKITKCDLLISHLADQIEDALGDGKAWGIKVSYHLVKDPSHPFKMISQISNSWGKEPVLLGQGNIFPLLQGLDVKEGVATIYQFPSKEWTGWGIVPANILASAPSSLSLEDFPATIKPFFNSVKTQSHLSTRTFQDYISSNIRPLTNKTPDFAYPTTAHEVQKGVWISRSVAIHRNVKIEQPVFIGENCQIMNDVEIGPDVVIERNCIIDKGSKIKHSLILKKSYVGENLELRDSIVDRNLLINITHDTAIRIRDDFILSEINPPPLFRYPLRWIIRGLAGLAFLLLFPIYYYLNRVCEIYEVDMLQLPTSTDTTEWSTFPYQIFQPKAGKSLTRFQRYFSKIPLLKSMWKGYIRVVGSAPRTPKDTLLLPEDWRRLYLKSKVGLITLAALDQGENATDDDKYAAEAYYATQMSFWLDVKLILRWLKGKLFWWVG
jgi:acetyltransferase-like isoleucine patch superfamily enzyme